MLQFHDFVIHFTCVCPIWVQNIIPVANNLPAMGSDIFGRMLITIANSLYPE